MIEVVNYLVLAIVLIVFILASYEDIKKREVYDFLNFGFLFSIIIVGVVDSLLISSFEPVKYVGIGLLVGFLLGTLLYYAGLWGGGDLKFLIGFGAASYYLIPFVTKVSTFSNVYNFAVDKLSVFLLIGVGYIIFVLLGLISLSILFIIIQFFRVESKKERRGLIYLFVLMLMLFFGLFLSIDILFLVLIGIVVFAIVFYLDEEVFSHVYIKKNKRISKLVEGDKTDRAIKVKNKIVVDNKSFLGLSKEDLIELSKHKFSKQNIFVRHSLPYGLLVGVSFFTLILKIVLSDVGDFSNISIFGFLFRFLFYSFVFGGIVAIVLLAGYAVLNYKKCRVQFNNIEKISLLISGVLGVLFTIVDFRFFLLLFFPVVYLFMKVAKELEKLMFVQDKSLEKIVPGDWIAEDIIVDNELIFSREDFNLGIEEEQIVRLKELAKKHKSLLKIKVKDGLAFLPPLFIGFILMMFF